MTIEDLYWNTVLVERWREDVRDPSGVPAGRWDAIYPNLKCRLVLRSGTENVVIGKLMEQGDAALYCSPSTDLQAKDRVVDDGKPYEVQAIRNVQGRFLAVVLMLWPDKL